EAIDGSLNKIEDGIKDIFKKKEKKPKKDKSKAGHIGGTQSGGSGSTANTSQQGDNTNFDAYKNFDFIPGKHIIFFDDFSDRSTKRWDAYEPSHLGVVQIENKPWLEVKGGRFYPVGLKVLPKDFTLEFDAYVLSNAPSGTLDISFVDKSQSDRLADPWYTNSGNIAVSPVSQMPKTGLGNYEKKINDAILSPQNEFKFYSWQPQLGNLHARVSIARKGNRLSLYINEEKVMDNIDLFDNNIDYMLVFHLGTYFIAETRM